MSWSTDFIYSPVALLAGLVCGIGTWRIWNPCLILRGVTTYTKDNCVQLSLDTFFYLLLLKFPFGTKLLRRIYGMIQVSFNVDLSLYSLMGSRWSGVHHGSSLLENLTLL